MTTLFVSILAGGMTVLRSRHRWWALCLACGLWWALRPVNWVECLSMRLQTYEMTLQASWAHPWLGHGTGMQEATFMLQARHAPLPAIHSTWLSLAFHHGWPATVLVGWMLAWLVRRSRSTFMRSAAVSLAVAAGLDDVFRWPGMAAVVLGVLVMLWQTQEARHA